MTAPQLDYRDLVIEELADSETALRERIASLDGENAGFRELLCAAMDLLHDLTVKRDREREQYARLKDEYRAFREQILLAAEAA